MRAAVFIVPLVAAAIAPVAAQSETRPRREVIYVEPTADDYTGMILAAAAWAKSMSKSIGVLKQDDASPAWLRGVATAAKEYNLKTIDLNDFTMICHSRRATRSAPAERICTMKEVETVLQFNALRIAGDSGVLVASMTRVPKGASRTETTHHCLMVVRKQGGVWAPWRAAVVPDPDKCIDGVGLTASQ